MISPSSPFEAEVFVLPTSFAQQRLWFLQQLMPDSAYNVPIAVQLHGQLDAAALAQAFNEIVRRHETLRTNFKIIDGQPMQAIAPSLMLPIAEIDLRSVESIEQQAEVQRQMTTVFQQPFDLSQDALLRIRLLRLGEFDRVLLIAMHHIVSDGWSIAILVRELGIFYTAFAAKKPSPLLDLPIQYADFAHWQRDWLQGEVLEKQLAYWQQQLKDAAPLELPIDRSRPAASTFPGGCESLLLPPELKAAIANLSDRADATLFMTLLAAFQTLLYRYTGQTDISIGSPIAGRNRSEIEGLIGFFANSLVLRVDVSDNPTFRELLARVRSITLEAYAHQDLPFEKLVEALQPDRSLHRNPLFQVVFALQNAPIEKLELPGLTLSPLAIDPGTVRFDLELQLVECQGSLGVVALYRSDLFEAETIARMLQHFQILLAGIVANSDRRLSELPLLSAIEQHQFAEWNQTQTDYPNWCIHHWFEAQVDRTPDAIALVCGNQQLTYRELNDRSNQLAHYLQQIGVVPEMRVGVCLERSIEMLISVLGVLKAGGAYVPIDPTYPPTRSHFMLADAQIAVLLTQPHLRELLEDCSLSSPDNPPDSPLNPPKLGDFRSDSPIVVCIEAIAPMLRTLETENPTSSVTPDSLAYIIYTSGSTGQPKGVLVAHRGLSNLAQAQIDLFQVQPIDRVLQFASLSFDASIFEMMMALSVGARLVLCEPNSLLGANLLRLLQTEKITHVTLPPTVLKLLSPADLPDLKTAIAAGEACPSDLVDRWATHCNFFNAYGLTETSVWATIAQLKIGEPVSIGRAISNTQIYVLDAQRQPVPIGISGELYISGDGLAQGYVNRPELTAEKFVFVNAKRLYQTGDLVRWRSNGNLEFLGRIDAQVKIRGLRIEIGEIEAALRQHDAIQAAIVVANSHNDLAEKQLIVHLVLHSNQTATTSELRNFLKQTLPDYMIPSAFAVQPELPLLPNGKVDYKALNWVRSPQSIDRKAPQTTTEAAIAKLWAEFLESEVDMTQSFFDQGGDSLKAMLLMDKIQQEFDRSLPLSTFFANPSIEQLAKRLEGDAVPNVPSLLVPLQCGGTKPPFFCVHPILGTVFPYYHLARSFEGDRSFYGLQPIGLDRTPHTSIEEMATCYIQAIRQVQPCSPYYIGGWSFGGFVAFEMAQQLHKAGEQVALLAILDTPAPIANNQPSYCETLKFLLTTAARSIPPLLLDYVRMIPPVFSPKSNSQQFKTLPSQLLNEFALHRLLEIYRANSQAILNYKPQIYPNTITLFRTEKRSQKSKDAALGWNDLTVDRVEVCAIAGDHFTMLRPPHVQLLGEQLRQQINVN